MQADGEIDFRTTFVREPGALRHHPALVLNADYRPLSYYPLSLWPWQEAVKAVWLDRVQIVAEYDTVVRSPSTEIRIPSVVVLRDYIKPQKRVAFTRFNLFLRDEFSCQYCGEKGDLTFDHVVPRARGGVTSWENVVAACSRCNLKKGLAQPAGNRGSACASRRASPGRRSCATWGGSSRPTTCTKAGSISSTGTRNWRPERPVVAVGFRVFLER
jgi:5-methylcytosine-specific restriction endonuclease McrA